MSDIDITTVEDPGIRDALITPTGGSVDQLADHLATALSTGTAGDAFATANAGAILKRKQAAAYTNSDDGHTLVVGEDAGTNSTSAAFSLVVPQTGTLGDRIAVNDESGTWGTYNVTLGHGSIQINGSAADLVLDGGGRIELELISTSPYNWRPIITSAGQAVGVQKAGSAIGVRGTINLIEGSNVTLTTTDTPASDRVDVTIAAAGGGSSAVAESINGARATFVNTNDATGYVPFSRFLSCTGNTLTCTGQREIYIPFDWDISTSDLTGFGIFVHTGQTSAKIVMALYERNDDWSLGTQLAREVIDADVSDPYNIKASSTFTGITPTFGGKYYVGFYCDTSSVLVASFISANTMLPRIWASGNISMNVWGCKRDSITPYTSALPSTPPATTALSWMRNSDGDGPAVCFKVP